MRIVVLGATSRTGLQLLAEARRRGHQIVAFTRRPGRSRTARRWPRWSAATAATLASSPGRWQVRTRPSRCCPAAAGPIRTWRPRLPAPSSRRCPAPG